MTTYKIFRVFQDGHDREEIATGLTLEEAKAHCTDPESGSSTCSSPVGLLRTKKFGQWYDCFTEEEE